MLLHRIWTCCKGGGAGSEPEMYREDSRVDPGSTTTVGKPCPASVILWGYKSCYAILRTHCICTTVKHPPSFWATVCKDWIYHTPKRQPSNGVNPHFWSAWSWYLWPCTKQLIATRSTESWPLSHLWHRTAPTLPCHSSCACYYCLAIIGNTSAFITKCQRCPWRECKIEDRKLCRNFMPKVGKRSHIWERTDEKVYTRWYKRVSCITATRTFCSKENNVWAIS